jgi:3-methyladenine DNA glycosylase AlkC
MNFRDHFDCAHVHAMGVRAAACFPSALPLPADALIACLQPLAMKDRVETLARTLAGLAAPDHPADGWWRSMIPGALPEASARALCADTVRWVEQAPALMGFAAWPALTLLEAVSGQAPDAALDAMGTLTGHFSAEFAVRPLLAHDPDRVWPWLEAWAAHPDEHRRRLASEGTRPRLPWGQALPRLRDQPTRMLPLLTRLRDDPSPYVRRSVANHLNDIGTVHADVLLDLAHAWLQDAPPERTALVRHALRTLLRRGHPRALALVGAEPGALRLEHAAVVDMPRRVGDTLRWTAQVYNPTSSAVRLELDFALHFPDARGGTRSRVVKGRRLTLDAGASLTLHGAIPLRPTTTRTLHPGPWAWQPIVNGNRHPPHPWTLGA